MKTLNIMLSNLAGRVIPIGYEGENLYTQVRINCIEVFADYPDATVGMVVSPPVGDMYPAVLEKSGAIVVWNITDTVLSAQGAGECQLTFTEGDVVRKSVIFGFNVNRSLVANGEAPDPIEDWIVDANRKLGELDGVARDETDEWLEEHITNPDSPPLDRTLSMANAAAPADMVGDLKSAISSIDNFLEISREDITFFDSYANSLSSYSVIANSPFVIPKAYNHTVTLVTKIKLSVYEAGQLSIGVIKSQYVVKSGTVDATKAIVKETLTITQTGTQEINLSTPFTVNPDEYIFICKNTDTCRFRFNGDSSEKQFFYTNNGATWAENNSGLGINVYASVYDCPNNVREITKSVYSGKTLSILGDSISTFAGYIPAGNATYYPSSTVQAVTDTWWKKLIDALGLTLDVNNSWSGSRVTTTNGETSAGCMTRCENLGETPDVIIVWMGINDFNNEVALGTYDGSTLIPDNTTTFREAYAIMLNKILTKYKTSEIWVCTLPQCERNGETGFPEKNGNGVALKQFNDAIKELAEAFGVKVLDHNKCGLTYQNMPVYNPDNLHPNKYGHSLIANNDIWQMDNAVSIRYVLSE